MKTARPYVIICHLSECMSASVCCRCWWSLRSFTSPLAIATLPSSLDSVLVKVVTGRGLEQKLPEPASTTKGQAECPTTIIGAPVLAGGIALFSLSAAAAPCCSSLRRLVSNRHESELIPLVVPPPAAASGTPNLCLKLKIHNSAAITSDSSEQSSRFVPGNKCYLVAILCGPH